MNDLLDRIREIPKVTELDSSLDTYPEELNNGIDLICGHRKEYNKLRSEFDSDFSNLIEEEFRKKGVVFDKRIEVGEFESLGSIIGYRNETIITNHTSLEEAVDCEIFFHNSVCDLSLRGAPLNLIKKLLDFHLSSYYHIGLALTTIEAFGDINSESGIVVYQFKQGDETFTGQFDGKPNVHYSGLNYDRRGSDEKLVENGRLIDYDFEKGLKEGEVSFYNISNPVLNLHHAQVIPTGLNLIREELITKETERLNNKFFGLGKMLKITNNYK